MSDIYYQYFTMRFRPQQKNTDFPPPSYDEGKSVFSQKSATIELSRTKTVKRREIRLSDSVQFRVTQERRKIYVKRKSPQDFISHG